MPKKKREELQAEQCARFQAEAQRLIDAGELSPEDAERVMDDLLTKSKRTGQ